MKKWLAIILGLGILAFVFADNLYYLAGRWQEKTGKVKRAARIYSRLIKKYPRSRLVVRAKEAIERLEKSGREREKRKRGEIQISNPVTPYMDILKNTKEKVKDIEEEKEEEYEKWLKEMEE